jgi:N4-gp56 family major capsid protein
MATSSAYTTPVLPTDPTARKAWAIKVGKQGQNENYFSKMIGGEGSRSIGIKRDELKKGSGDTVTTLISAKLQGAPRVGTERLEGTEQRIAQFATDIKIGLMREGVNVGSLMDEQRTGQQLGEIGRELLGDWFREYMEQFIHCHLAGTVGVSQGFTNVLDKDGNFKKIANDLVPFDDLHTIVGGDGKATKATLTDTNLFRLETLTRHVAVKISKQWGGKNQASRIEKASLGNGKSGYLVCLPSEVMADLKHEIGENGWVAWQQSLVRYMGPKAGPFVEDGGGFYGGKFLVDETPHGTYQTGYGSGGGVTSARSMVLGAGAFAIAQGRQGLRDSMSIELDEDSDDRGHERVIHMKSIFDVQAVRYNNMRHASIAIDTAFTPSVDGQY